MSRFQDWSWLVAILFFVTNIACTPTVYVVSADAAGFQQVLHEGMASDARRPAHLMASWIRGRLPDKPGVLDDAQLPEPYTPNIGSSIRPSEYHLAYAAERLIREHYAATHLQTPALETNHLLELVDVASGNTYAVQDFNREVPIDLGDARARAIFEVVPPGQPHKEAATERVALKLRLLNYAMIGVPAFHLGTDYHGEIGVRFAENTPPWKLTWATTAPGVVQYQWRTLRVDQPTERGYREAYLAHRWRELTSLETERYGRALHEVIQRLVLAREKLGETRAAEKLPILPGKTMADYTRWVALWSAFDDTTARLLPIMAKPPPPPPPVQVRRNARYVGQTVGGGSLVKMHPGATVPDGVVDPTHPSAPEGYTLDGLQGRMPYHFFLGYSAHRAIAYHYAAYHPLATVYKNFIGVKTIVDKSGGKPALLHWSEADLRPDIAHVNEREGEWFVYEIKPRGDVHLAKGKEKLAQYITAMNRGMVGTSKVFVPGPNYKGELVLQFKGGKGCWHLKWDTTAPGLLQYKLVELLPKVDEDGVASRSDCENAHRAGKWTDLSERQMAADGKDFLKDIDDMVRHREELGQLRDAVTVPIEGVGSVAEVILSAGLWDQMTGAPRVVAGVPKGVQTGPPAPQPPTQGPPVNAWSLGSDKRMAPKAKRPGTRPNTDSPN